MIAAAASKEVRWGESRDLVGRAHGGLRWALYLRAQSAASALASVTRHVDLLSNLAFGVSVAASPQNLMLCLIGALVGTLIGVLPGHRPGRHHRHAAADHLRPAAGRRADHARRHLLRRDVWRIDHRDPGEYPGRVCVRGDNARRPSDGAAGPCRTGACDRRHRLVLCGLRCHRDHRRGRCSTDQRRADVRAGGIFLADGARPDLRGRAGQGIGAQGDRHDPVSVWCCRWSARISKPAPAA